VGIEKNVSAGRTRLRCYELLVPPDGTYTVHSLEKVIFSETVFPAGGSNPDTVRAPYFAFRHRKRI